MRVLITGMSGTGKSAVVAELRARGHQAFDADEGWSARQPDGTWRWDVAAVERLLARHERGVVFFAGCSDEQRSFSWDVKVVLTVPQPVLVQRLATRTSNDFGKQPEELDRVLADRAEVEPLLLAAADLVVDTQRPLPAVVDEVLAAATAASSTPGC